jgi:peptidyl-prolyl cis-trans isomerase SurA
VTRFARILTLTCLCLLVLGLPLRPPAAQDSLAIAAVVNDDVISVLDLSVRTRMVIISARLEDTPETRNRLTPQVLRGLIDERLKLQEAELSGVSVPEATVNERVDELAAQNNMPRADFEQALMRNGVLIETIMEQIRAEIAWTLLIQRKLQPSVVVSDEEVDEALADLQANLGKPEYRVAEIYLATDAASGEDQVRQTAQRLADQLRQGADFESLARQFSQSATAARGGDLGWVRPGQLDGDLEAAVRDLQPGQVAGPLRSTGGYNILQLLDRRQTGGASVLDAMVSLRQVFIPLAQSAPAAEVDAAETLARSVIAQARSCDDMTRIARETNPQANADLGELRIGELPDVLRPIATDLELNRPSQPVRVESGIGVFMVCKREQPEAGLPTRQDIAQSIRNERLDVLARGYLRDLRRAAFVDVRV